MKNKNTLIGILIGLVIILLAYNIYFTNRSNNLLKNYQTEQQYQDDQKLEDNQTCDKDTKPWIKVVSPNGGETFILGQETTIRWSSCNLSNSMHLRAYLERQAPFPDHEWQSPILFGNVNEGIIASSLNDGEQLVILDSIHDVVPASYKLCIAEYVTPPGQNVIQDCSDNSLTINSSSEESSTEVFTNQPGAIKSITTNGNNKWLLSLDLLSYNPKWLTGVDSTGGFFINQNSKIRNLSVTNNTKTYNCGAGVDNNETTPDVLIKTSDFINKLETGEYKVRYLDINGDIITAMYEQCLP